jgi:sugar-specific transcriptional regulator TrmB
MQKNNKFISGLMNLGLTEREAKVFFALLNKRVSTISELQKLSGVPNSQIYRTIDSLVRQGFFTERQVNKKRTFEIIDPNLSLTRVLEAIGSQLEAGTALKQELGDIYASGESHTDPFEYIEVLHGNENIHNKYNQLVRLYPTTICLLYTRDAKRAIHCDREIP